MSKVLKSVLAVCVLSAAALVPSLPAQADDGLCDNPPQSGDTHIVSVTPSPAVVVVGPHRPVTQNFTAVVTDSCPIQVGVSNLTSYDGDNWQDPVSVAFDNGTQDGNTWTFLGTLTWDPATTPNGSSGDWTPATYAYGSGYDGTYQGSFSVAHATRLRADASPERVRRGGTVTVVAHLQTADWEKGRWTGLAADDVVLQYKKRHGAWTELQVAASDYTGTVNFEVTPARTGCYRAVFAGVAGNAASKSTQDCVHVRRHH